MARTRKMFLIMEKGNNIGKNSFKHKQKKKKDFNR